MPLTEIFNNDDIQPDIYQEENENIQNEKPLFDDLSHLNKKHESSEKEGEA